MKQAYVKGTNTKMVGTLERLTGKCGISGFEGDDIDDPVFDGQGTEVFWDDAVTATDNGRTVYLDESGNEYTSDQLELREEGAQEEDEDREDPDSGT